MIAVLLADDSTIVEIIIFIGIYLVYALVEKAKGKSEDEMTPAEVMASEAQAAAQALSKAYGKAHELESSPAWRRRGVGIAWQHVLIPELETLRSAANRPSAELDMAQIYSQRYRRLAMTQLGEQLEALARGGAPNLNVGLALVSSHEPIRAEAVHALGVTGDPDVVASPKLSSNEVRQLVAAWLPVLVADILTATLDKNDATATIKEVRQLPVAHISGQAGMPPAYIRAQTMARVLSQPFSARPPEGELIVRHSSGARFALPAEPITEETLKLVDTLRAHRWSSLGRRTLSELQSASVAVAPKVAPLLARRPKVETPAAAADALQPAAKAPSSRQAPSGPTAAASAGKAKRPPPAAPRAPKATPEHKRSAPGRPRPHAASGFNKAEARKAILLSEALPI